MRSTPSSAVPGPVAPCHLYYLYDVDERLLYVGMTDDVERRMEQHAMAQEWWQLVDRRWVVTYPSRAAAAAAEALTIHLLRPVHNVAVPDASRCERLSERVGTEVPAAVEVVVEVDSQRRRAERAEARVSRLEVVNERMKRRGEVKDRKLADLMDEMRRSNTELHRVVNDLVRQPLGPSGYGRGEVVHAALRTTRARCWDIMQGRRSGPPPDLAAVMAEQLMAERDDRPDRLVSAAAYGPDWADDE